jgi:hypothetical protein
MLFRSLREPNRWELEDMDSQIYKARILELLGKREEALTTLAACFRKGATDLQVAPFPDLQSLRKDPWIALSAVSGPFHPLTSSPESEA